MKQKGQVLLILIFVMTVALAIGLSIVQKSLLDISTSTKVEQSAKAFSAAEAGIEKALQTNSSIQSPIPVGDATLESVQVNTVPDVGQALEYPPVAKEELAQVWLADPKNDDASGLPKQFYSANTLDVYWGNEGTQISNSDTPAIEITLVYQDGSGNYKDKKYFYDPISTRGNGFIPATNCPSDSIATSFSATAKQFMCKQTIPPTGSFSSELPNFGASGKLMLLRARLLYSGISHAFAVKPASGSSLPVQGSIFLSTGLSGETQRRVRVFKLDKVVPPYFDYALFSVAEITK
ncbi:MAG: pilus assembly PilX N-terminal domain-containing protein [Patescibacteria group bacterium]